MATTNLDITRGTNNKPIATDALIESLEILQGLKGKLFTGYPVIATPDGKYSMDATLVSPSKGVVLFDLIEGRNVEGYDERQDDLANKIESLLKPHRELVKGRHLLVPISVMSFAPGVPIVDALAKEGYRLANDNKSLDAALSDIKWVDGSDELYRMTLSAIESLSSIRKSRFKREIHRKDSRGAKLKVLEDSISTLDYRQSEAVIGTVDGVQRIRGLAGSGKTIVLALKAAYLHIQHPNWRIAVTFHTRSLKGQFRRLINYFCIAQGGEEPDWTKIRIVNAWGAPGEDTRDGIYYEYCRATGTEFLDFKGASIRGGGNEKAFDYACEVALANISAAAQVYDVILTDEAQDSAPSFLKICYSMLKPPKRLVYAYDELQNLSGVSLPPPEEIFGNDENGQALVTFDNDHRRDVILQKCYRNSRPVLVCAHGLGFGIYRDTPPGKETGLVQMFDYPGLWKEIGYNVQRGELVKGHHIVLERTEETSPGFLENHSDIDDLIQFIKFDDEEKQNEYLVREIKTNLQKDELNHNDILVIHPDPLTTRAKTAPIRKQLFNAGVQTHLAGVDTDPDVFFRPDAASVTFTGIYRAKGNEAGMVYVINAQECNTSDKGLSSLRNRLFTAITRSKAWVRIIGYGPQMQGLINEFSALKQRGFVLDFCYPNDALLGKLRIVHRDLSSKERRIIEQKKNHLVDLVDSLESGELHLEDFDEVAREKLRKILGKE